MTTKLVRVDWDTVCEDIVTGVTRKHSFEELDLPHTVDVPTEIIDQEEDEAGSIADWLSDEYGWCVNSVEILD